MNSRRVRVVAFSAYFVVFVWAAFVFGLPTDRIAVLSWVLGGFACGAVGRPLRDWFFMLRDFSLFVAMWFAYDYSRGMADQVGFPVNHTLPRDVDRLLFLGSDPNVWLQDKFYEPGAVRWYDVAGSLIYFTHFCVPMGIAIALWARNRDRWVQYVRRLATVLFLGVATFVVFPAAPPWMVSKEGGMDLIARPTVRGWTHLGLDTVSRVIERGREVVNPVAAVPSLHVAFSLIVVLFFAKQMPKWLWPIVVVFPASMMLTLVYFGEHFVFDGIMGVAYVLIAFRFWSKYEASRRGAVQKTSRFAPRFRH
jgi:hypothetical protein